MAVLLGTTRMDEVSFLSSFLSRKEVAPTVWGWILKPCALSPIVNLPSGIVPTYLVILRDRLRSISRQLAVGSFTSTSANFILPPRRSMSFDPTGAFTSANPLSFRNTTLSRPYT